MTAILPSEGTFNVWRTLSLISNSMVLPASSPEHFISTNSGASGGPGFTIKLTDTIMLRPQS